MFYFERKSKTPLYQQLYEQLRQQITEGSYSYCRTQPEESLFQKVEKSEILYDFYYGNLDYNCYQSKVWRRCLMDACDWIFWNRLPCQVRTQVCIIL